MSDQDKMMMAAVTSLRPAAAWNFRYGQGIAGLDWLDPKVSRPTDAEITAEMARLAQHPLTTPAAIKLDQHMATAIEEFSALKDKGIMSDTENQQPQPASATLIPAADPAPATPLPRAPTITARATSARRPAPAGGFAASIRAMMDEARQGVLQARADGLAQVQDAVATLADAKHATAKVAGQMAQTIRDEAADVLAELGQISNDIG